MIMKQFLLYSFLVMLIGFSQQALAQGVTTAAISGIVTDDKGEGIPGANIIAVHTPSGTQYGTVTRVDGRYNFPNVRVGGPYTVTASFVGYNEQKKEGINLALAQDFTIDFNLKEASIQLGAVEVKATKNAIISSDRTGASTAISNAQISRNPTLNRSFDDFTRLDPRAQGQNFAGRNGGYNNITIDGALFNNSFGLSSTVGGQAGAQPISLDAIDQIQVSIAPYDVRQGSFTGASINAVTRSGTNEFEGSAYYFLRNQKFVGDKLEGNKSSISKFDLFNTGFRLGGPIIKNKLFFFVNAEMQLRNDPLPGNYVATRDGVDPNSLTTSKVLASDLDGLRSFLTQKYNYDPGPYEGYLLKSNSWKATAKLDWNISKNHRFNIKYNYLKSYSDVPPSSSGALSGGRSPSVTNMPFLGAYYRINNNLNSVIAELNSTFGSKFSNTFTAGYTGFRDFREVSAGTFPLVDIGNNSGQALTSFGYEPFSANNVLNTDIYQISDNFTIYAGKNVFTIGTYNEFYKFRNGFAPNYNSNYQFASLEDFYSNANQVVNPSSITPANPTGTISNPTLFQIQYSALPDGSFPFAKITARQYGVYAQDEISLLKNFKVTVGIRADIPIIPTDITQNVNAANLTFRDGVKINTSQVQKTSLLWSPRVGFNWDVKDDKTTQIRGGTGIFTGRVPYVWISNQASNNGVQFGSQRLTTLSNDPTSPNYRPFNPSVDAYRPTGAAANTAYNLAVTDNNFKFPQVWRSNLALDQQLPWGIIGTLEGIYTKDINAVYHQNVNLPNPTRNAIGPDNRPIYYFLDANGIPINPKSSSKLPDGTYAPAKVLNNRINGSILDPANPGTELVVNNKAVANTPEQPNISDAIIMKNTNKGYSYAITAQLQKTFANGFFASVAYTYSQSKSVNDGGSIAQSIWRDRVISGDPNADVLGYSRYMQKDRFLANVSYRKEYLNKLATSISLFYNLAPGSVTTSGGTVGVGDSRFSYTYVGDMNGDGSGGGGNDLIYIPRTRGDILLTDIVQTDKTGAEVYRITADQQYTALDAYINQDKYLSERRGQYAERNGAQMPLQSRLDLKIIQEFFVNVGGKRNTLQFSLDLFNLGNLINSDWSLIKAPNRAALISFAGNDKTTGQPTFQFPNVGSTTTSPGTPLTSTFRTDAGISTASANLGASSRWQMQLGIRYIFGN